MTSISTQKRAAVLMVSALAACSDSTSNLDPYAKDVATPRFTNRALLNPVSLPEVSKSELARVATETSESLKLFLIRYDLETRGNWYQKNPTLQYQHVDTLILFSLKLAKYLESGKATEDSSAQLREIANQVDYWITKIGRGSRLERADKDRGISLMTHLNGLER